MNFIYTTHSKDNLIERKINKKDVEDSILNPNEIIDTRKSRKIAHKMIGKKLLRVVYKEDKKAYIVITAYYAKPEKYKK